MKFSSIISLIVLLTAVHNVKSNLNYRLDKFVIPESYDIYITPYLLEEDGAKQFTFDGQVDIKLRAKVENIKEIVLHKDYIDIQAVELLNASNSLIESININSLSYETETDKLTVPLKTALNINVDYILSFKYVGQIRDGMAGVFRVNTTDIKGNHKWILATQLHRIDARTAFPCFDEPAMKAKFTMHINRHREYTSIFNTLLSSSVPDGSNRVVDNFAQSPLMSTYLVAFMVNDFRIRGDDTLAIITNPMYHDYTRFSFGVAFRALVAYNDQFKQTYKDLGNPVMQIAGSSEFPHNGMENWGLIICRENVLVQLPKYSDGLINEEYTISVLVHEIAHMWFGNSVTNEWWSYFWLNEAFARYYQYFMAHKVYPEFQFDLQFVVNEIHSIFETDALNTTQPMTSTEISVNTPAEIGKQFSSIAYAKGAAIVRMICNIMGEANFNVAIQNYLTENHLKNVEPQNLFNHLKANWPAGPQVDLDQFFYDWTEQVGYPVIEVQKYYGNDIIIYQRRFLLNPDDGSDPDLLYTIPITYATHKNRKFEDLKPTHYFTNPKVPGVGFKITVEPNYEWVILNLQQSNYYRVFYSPELLEAIRWALLRQDYIHELNRAQLIDDLFTFARVEQQEYETVFKFIEFLSEEVDYTPWQATFKNMLRVAQRIPPGDKQKLFTEFLEDITVKVYEKIDFVEEPKTVIDVYKRNKVVLWLCKYGHSDCLKEVTYLFDRVVNAIRSISIDFREIVFCAAVRYQTEPKYWLVLQDMWLKETVDSEKQMLLRAMGCVSHQVSEQYKFIINSSLDNKNTALTSLYTQTPGNPKLLFMEISADVNLLFEALGSWGSTATFIRNLANYFTTNEEEQLLKTFIEQQGSKFGTSINILNAALTDVQTNLQWTEKRLGKLFVYLQERKDNGSNLILSSAILIACSALLNLFFK